MRVAVIPARGGSKRIPRKNIKLFCGKPIIVWSIDAALNCEAIDKVVVSTDDPEIADVAKAHGAEVPFLRPSELADDFTPTIPVIQHSIEWYTTQGLTIDAVCCIYATAPFVQSADLLSGYESLVSSAKDYSFSVTSYAFPIQRALKQDVDGVIEMFYPEYFNTRSQDLEEAWHDAGQFYWGNSNAWLEGRPIFTSLSAPVILPRHRVQDIDTPEDWLRAENMFKILNENSQ